MTPHSSLTLPASLRADAVMVVRAIARDLLDIERVLGAVREVHESPSGVASLSDGLGGTAMFLAEAGVAMGEQALIDASIEQFDFCRDTIEHSLTSYSLHSGFCGTAWLYSHLESIGIVADADRALEDIDAALHELLTRATMNHPFDLIHGLVGVGTYGLCRQHTTAGTEILRLTIDRLLELARHSEDGAAWLTPTLALPPSHRLRYPDGFFNCGIAHGQPGVILLLSNQYSLRHRWARQALVDATRWLRAHRLPNDSRSRYPRGVTPGKKPEEEARLSWCYGDLGVAISFWAAGVALDDSSLKGEGRIAAEYAARRDAPSSGVVDATVCHGSSGVSLMLAALTHCYPGGVLLASAHDWFRHALAQQGPNDGRRFGGYEFVESIARDLEAPPVPRPLPGVRNGAAGVGLVFMYLLGMCNGSWLGFLLPGWRAMSDG